MVIGEGSAGFASAMALREETMFPYLTNVEGLKLAAPGRVDGVPT